MLALSNTVGTLNQLFESPDAVNLVHYIVALLQLQGVNLLTPSLRELALRGCDIT